MEKLCAYDECHTFESESWNGKYCTECKCKRKAENKKKQLKKPHVYDEEVWQLQENRKLALAHEREERDVWILRNKKIAMFDIETTNLDADIGEMLCACIKPLGGKVKSFVVDTTAGDGALAASLREELRNYDYVVTWYGTKFDMPYLTTRLISAGEETLGYMRHVDLYYTSRFKLKLHSNRLAAVGEFMFGKTSKTRVIGPIWLRAIRGDKEAMDYIVKHCQMDVRELELIFCELVPHRNLSATPLRKY
jgi:uncharacterized protein YprB with RNaseH-like and TPR domain